MHLIKGYQRIKGAGSSSGCQTLLKTLLGETVQLFQLITNAKVSINHQDQLGPSHQDILRHVKTI